MRNLLLNEIFYFYYTLDGSEPTQQSKKYTGPFPTDGKVDVKAIAYDPATDKSSAVALERFDIGRKDWKIVGAEDEKYMQLWTEISPPPGTNVKKKCPEIL